MAKRQTRRSISFRAEVFERLRRFCEANDASMAGWVEKQITEVLDAHGEPVVTREEALNSAPRHEPAESTHPGSHFTR